MHSDHLVSGQVTTELAVSRVMEHGSATPIDAASHFRSKLVVETDPSDVYDDLRNGEQSFVVVDTRSKEAYTKAHIPAAISMPHRNITKESTAAWPKDKLLVLYCFSPACNAAAKAAVKLAALGFTVKEMIGGIEYWEDEGYPLQKEGEPPVALTTPVLG
jgi:rhodanese-related sulfurtransferase